MKKKNKTSNTPEFRAAGKEPEPGPNPMRWCSDCRSYHVRPKSLEHWQELKCFRPWQKWQDRAHLGALPPKVQQFQEPAMIPMNVMRFLQRCGSAGTDGSLTREEIRDAACKLFCEHWPEQGKRLFAIQHRDVPCHCRKCGQDFTVLKVQVMEWCKATEWFCPNCCKTVVQANLDANPEA